MKPRPLTSDGRPSPVARLACTILLVACWAGGGCAPATPPSASLTPLSSAPPLPYTPADQVAMARDKLLRRIAGLIAPRGGAPPDWAAAAEELNRHLALYPADRDHPPITVIAHLLRAVARLSSPAPRSAASPAPFQAKAFDPADQSRQEIRALKAELERLGNENRELRTIVERLKALEVDMERKRRAVR